MKIKLQANKVYFENRGQRKEIYPFWLRERVNNKEYLDQLSKQRLFDPTELDINVLINKAKITNEYLKINFDDGVFSKFHLKTILNELIDQNNDIRSIPKIKWDSSLKRIKNFNYENNLSESKKMYDLLISFYKYGFVIIKNVPVKKNFIVKFANSIGSVRRTNFGEYFNIKSKHSPNDLAYTSLHLAPHTDNPYRKPVPCIQLLHCIKNKVIGGNSTLVDGYTVTEDLKKKHPKFYNILTNVKVKFKFIDKNVVLEDWSELIKLDDKKNFQQIRFSPRLDYVPILNKNKLNLFYKARKKLSEMLNSKKYSIEFKLKSKDLLMMDNYRSLHGRTAFDTKNGTRFLQGCYIDYDSTDGKLKHLKRKLNL